MEATLNLNNYTDKEILDLFGAQSFIKAYDYQYDDIESIGKKLGKIR